MRTLSFLVTAMILAATVAGQTRQGKAADEEAIRKLADQYVAAFNRKDTKAVAEIWAEDGAYTSGITGRVAKGRTEVESYFREAFSGPYRDAKTKLITLSVRFLTPDVALADGTWESSGARGPDGKERPTIRSLSLSVVTKQGGQWRVVATLAMVPPDPARDVKGQAARNPPAGSFSPKRPATKN